MSDKDKDKIRHSQREKRLSTEILQTSTKHKDKNKQLGDSTSPSESRRSEKDKQDKQDKPKALVGGSNPRKRSPSVEGKDNSKKPSTRTSDLISSKKKQKESKKSEKEFFVPPPIVLEIVRGGSGLLPSQVENSFSDSEALAARTFKNSGVNSGLHSSLSNSHQANINHNPNPQPKTDADRRHMAMLFGNSSASTARIDFVPSPENSPRDHEPSPIITKPESPPPVLKIETPRVDKKDTPRKSDTPRVKSETPRVIIEPEPPVVAIKTEVPIIIKEEPPVVTKEAPPVVTKDVPKQSPETTDTNSKEKPLTDTSDTIEDDATDNYSVLTVEETFNGNNTKFSGSFHFFFFFLFPFFFLFVFLYSLIS